mmetsp:Transcript_7251/g.12057  ORF Transcript_7251/g.12057 Transcript_7251/m.12057 type:complete len:127 (+) Transcript_7251:116-496(+)|eukprot:CAMPEP_0174996648 /NCGR_PEP_ID=MMETSP0005-20121125/515_1 /TAXON_ID=420556 /ORGANISM="Ochromonas sp., Strain CCMP1393" /LENGTH=126 /DNA_ID=CAMNT_0016251087 /DNA_START=67 /DNA_END=447 /DNA_ORIENTATION=+
MESSSATSVDDLQNQIDQMVLTVFEAVRNASSADADPSDQAGTILDLYNNAVNSVDSLVGIDRKEAEQLQQLDELSSSYEASRSNVLLLEQELLTLKCSIEDVLLKNLDNESLNLDEVHHPAGNGK